MSISKESTVPTAVRRNVIALVVGASLSFANVGIDVNQQLVIPNVVHADSTGKMSTKLTAKKRYLPRIVSGVAEFKALGKDLTPATVAAFLSDGGDKSSSDKLVRAMNLFGLSLRKGETPDEISRTAEKLTTSFETEVNKLGKSKDLAAQYKTAAAVLDQYLEFAKIEL
jgi:hypothetical protein